ncbi:Receptor-like protein 4 [Bienertia sinuspersici]
MGLSITIPSDFDHLPYLSALSIAENVNVTGTIPVSLAKLKELNSLHLSLNSY